MSESELREAAQSVVDQINHHLQQSLEEYVSDVQIAEWSDKLTVALAASPTPPTGELASAIGLAKSCQGDCVDEILHEVIRKKLVLLTEMLYDCLRVASPTSSAPPDLVEGATYHCTYCDGPHHEEKCPNRCKPSSADASHVETEGDAVRQTDSPKSSSVADTLPVPPSDLDESLDGTAPRVGEK